MQIARTAALTNEASRLTGERGMNLVTTLKNYSRRSISAPNQPWSFQQEVAIAEYAGRARGDEGPGMSNRVTREVAWGINSIRDAIMRALFMQGRMLEIIAGSPDMEDAAMEAAAGIDHIIRQHPEIRSILEGVYMDGAISRLGAGRVDLWEPPPEPFSAFYQPYDSFLRLANDAGIKIAEYAVVPMPGDDRYMYGVAFHIRGTRKRDPRILIQNIEPETLRILHGTRTLDQTLPNGPNYIGHLLPQRIDDIIRMYPERQQEVRAINIAEDEEVYQDTRSIARNAAEGGWGQLTLGDNAFEAGAKEIFLRDEFVRFDMDNDGYAELVNVRRIHNLILHASPIHDNPLFGWTPFKLPHKVVGQSLVDYLSDIQRTRTDLTRGLLNVLGLFVNPRTLINTSNYTLGDISHVDTIEDLTSSTIGSIVRVAGNPREQLDYMMPPTEALQGALAALETPLQEMESRIGIGPSTMGSSQAPYNRTSSGAHLMQKQASGPTENIAANFGQGLEMMVRKIQRLAATTNNKAFDVKVNGKWHKLDASRWDADAEVRINISGALLDRDSKLLHLRALQEVSEKVLTAFGPDNPIHGIRELRNLLEEVTATMGISHPERFFRDVSDEELQTMMEAMAEQGTDPKVEAEIAAIEAKTAMEAEKIRMDAQKNEAEIEIALLKLQLDHLAEMKKIALDAQDNTMRMSVEARIAAAQMAIEAATERLKMESNERVAKSKAIESKPIKSSVRVGGKKTG